MTRKFILTCAAAVAAIGLALAPVSASAKGHHSHGSHHSHHHGKHAHAHHHKHHHHMHHAHHHHKHHHKKHHWHHWKHYKYYYPKNYYYEEDDTPSYTYSKPSYTQPSYVYSKPAPAPSCTCLTKEYAPDGTVIFKDVCTKETAVSEPGATKAEN